MADKGKKRKTFDVPSISDLEEVIEVTPVFNRLQKIQNQAALTKICPKSSTTAVSKELKPSDYHGNTESSISLASDKNSCLKSVNNAEIGDQTELCEKGRRDTVHVGRNFMETFAFIETTKHYEEPKPSKSASSFTESV